jgi:crotonobetainyl-CoA:carnitine CoA-transferase CaiB-like acyl-CoA transferase
MGQYSQAVYATLHKGMKTVHADLKTEKGHAILNKELARAQVLLTSFRPSAFERLNLGWKKLHKAHPHLSQIAIVGASGERAEEPGHDLTRGRRGRGRQNQSGRRRQRHQPVTGGARHAGIRKRQATQEARPQGARHL